MITLVLAAMLAVALCLFGVAVVLAAEQERDADLQALILSQDFVDELNVEAERWGR